VCPGFAVDCLETLEEIALRYTELFIRAGGKALHYIPALNAQPRHAATLAGLIETNAAGWLEPAP
jgi:ferrochelatase